MKFLEVTQRKRPDGAQDVLLSLGTLLDLTLTRQTRYEYYKFVARSCNLQGGARNIIPLIVQLTHSYYYKNI